MPKVRKKLPKFVTLEDIKEALDYFEFDRDKALLVFLWETGIRRAELVNLDWGDITWDESNGIGEAIIRDGKGGKDRIALFNSFAWRFLKIYRGQVPHGPADPAFQSLTSGERLTGDGVYQVFYDRREKLPKPLYPHLFRHSFGRHAMMQGMPPAALKELMGHESIETTMLYARFTEPMVRDAYKKHMWSGDGD
jgi:integrase/recombinase XerD